MRNLFERTSSIWVRYSEYEWKKDKDGVLYLTPAPDAAPDIYDPLKEAETLVVEAVNIGRLCMRQEPCEKMIRQRMLDFAKKYGLFGFMTALPTTSSFMDYEAVYLPKNEFIREEKMDTNEYLNLFFPFEKLDVVKNGVNSSWSVYNDRVMLALMLTMEDLPMAVNMSFQRQYAERYDWLKTQFRDWAFKASTCYFYYDEDEQLPEQTRIFMRQSMAVTPGNAPTYRIALLETPTLVWDFHSLLLGIQMMFSLMLTDEKTPLRICRQCTQAFVASRPSAVFCSPKCKNQYNVYKSRAKKNHPNGEGQDDD